MRSWARCEAKARRSLEVAAWTTANKRQGRPTKQPRDDLRNDWADSYHRVLSGYRSARINGCGDIT